MRRLWLAACLALPLAGCDREVAAADGPWLADLAGTLCAPSSVSPGELHVVIFTSTDCPIANAYAPELQAIQRDFADLGARFFFVHVNPALTPQGAREHARDYGYDEGTRFLLDPEHRLVATLGATITPEVFVLGEGGQVLYRGRIDDQYGEIGRKRPRATRHELRDVLEQLRSGTALTVAPAPAVGCFIE